MGGRPKLLEAGCGGCGGCGAGTLLAAAGEQRLLYAAAVRASSVVLSGIAKQKDVEDDHDEPDVAMLSITELRKLGKHLLKK